MAIFLLSTFFLQPSPWFWSGEFWWAPGSLHSLFLSSLRLGPTVPTMVDVPICLCPMGVCTGHLPGHPLVPWPASPRHWVSDVCRGHRVETSPGWQMLLPRQQIKVAPKFLKKSIHLSGKCQKEERLPFAEPSPAGFWRELRRVRHLPGWLRGATCSLREDRTADDLPHRLSLGVRKGGSVVRGSGCATSAQKTCSAWCTHSDRLLMWYQSLGVWHLWRGQPCADILQAHGQELGSCREPWQAVLPAAPGQAASLPAGLPGPRGHPGLRPSSQLWALCQAGGLRVEPLHSHLCAFLSRLALFLDLKPFPLHPSSHRLTQLCWVPRLWGFLSCLAVSFPQCLFV